MRVSLFVVVASCTLIACVSAVGKKKDALTIEVEPHGSVRSHVAMHLAPQEVESNTVRLTAVKGVGESQESGECHTAVGGFYIDPNHYKEGTLAGTRMISSVGRKGQIVLIGSDDGTEFWKLIGKSSGSCGSFAIDFSPKGGPPDAVSSYEDGFLKFGDGNAWKKKVKREPLEATGWSTDIGGFYTDPNHYHDKDMSWAGTRYVSQKEGNESSDKISIVGSDDGTDFYALSGASVGELDFFVDFSAKGGPPKLSAKFQPSDSTIHWPDGNVWSRV